MQFKQVLLQETETYRFYQVTDHVAQSKVFRNSMTQKKFTKLRDSRTSISFKHFIQHIKGINRGNELINLKQKENLMTGKENQVFKNLWISLNQFYPNNPL